MEKKKLKTTIMENSYDYLNRYKKVFLKFNNLSLIEPKKIKIIKHFLANVLNGQTLQ